MNTKDITIITTFDNEVFEIDKNINEWLEITEKYQKIGKKKIFLEKYDFVLYFSTIKSERGKKLHLALPEAKEPLRLSFMGSKEQKKLRQTNPEKYNKLQKRDKEIRRKIEETAKKYKENMLENRKKNFLEERKELLKRLSIKEVEL